MTQTIRERLCKVVGIIYEKTGKISEIGIYYDIFYGFMIKVAIDDVKFKCHELEDAVTKLEEWANSLENKEPKDA